MRIRLSLSFTGSTKILPINANYFQTSLIYRILTSSSSEYSQFLHDQGYIFRGEKAFKLFTYSQFLIPERRIQGENLVSLSKEIAWVVSSPVEQFVRHLVYGLFEQRTVDIRGTTLTIESVETEAEPDFSGKMEFVCLSPIVVSVQREDRQTPYYIRPDEEPERFSEAVRNNLVLKYETLYGCEPEDNRLTFHFDEDYIRKRKGKISRLIRLPDIQVKAFMAPFTAEGSVELIRLGYEAGFGEKNSLGFGMARVDAR